MEEGKEVMEKAQCIRQFTCITSAPLHVAEHVLEAHAWDLDSAVDFYLESGGVGHGNETVEEGHIDSHGAVAGRFADVRIINSNKREIQSNIVSNVIDMEDKEKTEGGGEEDENLTTMDEIAPESNSNKLQENAPVKVWDNTCDEDIKVLDSTFIAQESSRRDVGDSIQSDEEWQPEKLDLEVFSEEEDDWSEWHQSRSKRANDRQRQRLKKQIRKNLAKYDREDNETSSVPCSGKRSGSESLFEDANAILPDDVDIDEQRMLAAAFLGEEYEGRIPEFESHKNKCRLRSISPLSQERLLLRQEQDAAYQESLIADQEKEKRQREASEAEEKERLLEKERRKAYEKWIENKSQSLPKEPDADQEEAVHLMVKLPEGGRLNRRFRRSDSLSLVFDWVDVSLHEKGIDIKPENYNLVSQFPRRVFGKCREETLENSNLAHRQEALFIEQKE